MSEVGIRSLKQNASAVVAQVAAGETVTITDRGRPVALLTPIPSSPLRSLLDAGRGRQAKRLITELAHPQPGISLSSELAGQREAERY
jgi:prevent-host-death family protein